jgi:hypothetical protein
MEKRHARKENEFMKKSFVLIVSIFTLIQFLWFRNAFAGRPLSTDDAWTVEKGQFQVETSLDVTRQDNHDREISPSVTLSYGLLENMDIGICSSYLFVHPKEGENENGLGEMEIKLKYRLLGEKIWMPAFAVAGKVKIPTASDSKGLGSGKADFGINAIFSKELSKKFVLHLNLGYTFIGEHGADNEMNYSGAAQLILSDKWTLVGEVSGVNNLNGRRKDDPLSGLIGTTYLITDKIIWDAGIEAGVNKAAPDYRLTTGLTVLSKP